MEKRLKQEEILTPSPIKLGDLEEPLDDDANNSDLRDF